MTLSNASPDANVRVLEPDPGVDRGNLVEVFRMPPRDLVRALGNTFEESETRVWRVSFRPDQPEGVETIRTVLFVSPWGGRRYRDRNTFWESEGLATFAIHTPLDRDTYDRVLRSRFVRWLRAEVEATQEVTR